MDQHPEGCGTASEARHVAVQCRSAGWGCIDCKKVLLESLLRELDPIRERARELQAHPERIAEILVAGAERCRAMARETMTAVKTAMGLL